MSNIIAVFKFPVGLAGTILMQIGATVAAPQHELTANVAETVHEPDGPAGGVPLDLFTGSSVILVPGECAGVQIIVVEQDKDPVGSVRSPVVACAIPALARVLPRIRSMCKRARS
jgi:hypothetical protein